MISIHVRNTNEISAATLADELGRVYLDLPDDFEVIMTKAMDRFNDVQEISQEVALTVDLPATSRNRMILSEYGGPLLYERKERLLIDVFQDGERLPLLAAYVTDYDPQGAGSYEVEMFGDDWKDELEELTLDQLELGTFEYTAANVLSAWGDRGAFAVPMFAHYGGWNTPGDVTRKDLRFWFNAGELLRRMFCAIGWDFKSPHYDAGDGRANFVYLGGENWYSYTGKRAFGFVELAIDGPFQADGFGSLFEAWVEVQDPNDQWNSFRLDEYAYSGATPGETTIRIRHRLNLSFTLPPPNPEDGAAPRLDIACIKNDNGDPFNVLFVETLTGSPDQEIRRTVELEFEDENANQGDGYFIQIFYNGSSGAIPFTIESGEWYIEPDPPYLVEDDVIPLRDMLDPTRTASEHLEAVAHLINGKLVTDYAQRQVTLYAPYDYERSGDEALVEGFYLRARPIDARSITVPDSIAWANKARKQNRYLIYKLADSDDARVEQFGTAEFERRVDRGVGVAKEDKVENPLYEPSSALVTDPADTGGTGARALALWDNVDGVISREVGPRIAVFYGRLDTGGSISFEGQIITDPTYLALRPSSLVTGLDAQMFLAFNGSSADLYNRFYRREVMQDDDGSEYEVLLLGGDETYDAVDFRRPLLVQGEQSTILIQPTAVKDHERGSSVPLLVSGRILKC